MTYIQLYPKILELLFYNLTFNLKELCTDLLQMLCNRGIYQGHTDKYGPSSLYWHLMKVWNIRSSLIKLPELHLHNNYLLLFINKIFFQNTSYWRYKSDITLLNQSNDRAITQSRRGGMGKGCVHLIRSWSWSPNTFYCPTHVNVAYLWQGTSKYDLIYIYN